MRKTSPKPKPAPAPGRGRLAALTLGLAVAALPCVAPASVPASAPTNAPASVSAALALLKKGDVAAAAQGFRKAWNGGDADGAFYLGRLFELGLGTRPDLRRAAALYSAAADKGSALAENRLGMMYLSGQGVVKDYAHGTELACKAAAAGNAGGEVTCGRSYSTGTGVAKDLSKARGWWRKAAAQHSIAALDDLGQSWLGSAPPAPAKALHYFDQAAAYGDAMALFETARLLHAGKSAKPDPVTAYAYADLAAADAYPGAAALRDTIEKTLSPAQVTAAQKMAFDFRPKQPAKGPVTKAQKQTQKTKGKTKK